MATNWFIKVGRIKHAGPYSKDELQQMIAARKVKPATQVCREVDGVPDGRWEHVSTVTGLMPHIPRGPENGPEDDTPPTVPVPTETETAESEQGLGRAVIIALWSGVFVIFLIGLGIVFWINSSYDEKQRQRDHEVAVLIDQAKKEVAANHLKEAKEAAIEAKKIPESGREAEINQVLNLIEQKQASLDKRFDAIIVQAEKKIEEDDLKEAKALVKRAMRITLASNFEQARSLSAKIRGMEQERRDSADEDGKREQSKKPVKPSKPADKKDNKPTEEKKTEPRKKPENPFEDKQKTATEQRPTSTLASTVTQARKDLKGMTKSEVKAYLGRKPDEVNGTDIWWYARQRFWDSDSETRHSTVTIYFDSGRANMILFGSQ